MELKGKTALVLGAVKGVGKAIGIALAKQGVNLALTRYDWTDSFKSMEEDFAKLESISKLGEPTDSQCKRISQFEYKIYDVNLLEIDQIKQLKIEIEERFGKIDILINNIERGGWPAVHGEYIEEQWDLEMATTLKAKRWVFNEMLPLLKKSDDAVVINFSSIAAVVGRSGAVAPIFNDGYSAAVRGVSLLTETWAKIGAPSIRVNEIMLGIFETRHAQGTRGWETVLTESEKKAIIDHTLIGRTGNLDDIVKAVLFIIKDAPYMTGSILRLDGGYLLGGQRVPSMPIGIL
ncbi:MAG: SDR family oxidoreductase [Desulfamplus sp.]|nr:SDR family oxidoreductase [Desulfamplus sp.]